VLAAYGALGPTTRLWLWIRAQIDRAGSAGFLETVYQRLRLLDGKYEFDGRRNID
jgi:hypothetical protein